MPSSTTSGTSFAHEQNKDEMCERERICAAAKVIPAMYQQIVHSVRPAYLLPEDRMHEFTYEAREIFNTDDEMHAYHTELAVYLAAYTTMYTEYRPKFLLLQRRIYEDLRQRVTTLKRAQTLPCTCCSRNHSDRMHTIHFPVDLVSPTFHACIGLWDCVHVDALDIRLCHLANNCAVEEHHKRWLCELLIRTSSATLPELYLEYKALAKLCTEREQPRLHLFDERPVEVAVAKTILDERFRAVLKERKKYNTLVALCDSCVDDGELCWTCADQNKDSTFADMDALDMYAALQKRRKERMKYALRTRSVLRLDTEVWNEEEAEQSDSRQHTLSPPSEDINTSRPKKKARASYSLVGARYKYDSSGYSRVSSFCQTTAKTRTKD